MAGLEQLEIHSKAYIVRWVKVEEGHTISWSVQPHKKSINFGIFKHPGSSSSSKAGTPQVPLFDEAPTSSAQQLDAGFERQRRASSVTKNDLSTAQEQLRAKGFLAIQWVGKCEADKVSMGTYAVPAGQGGMYGLVFDNTFSKQLSKTATFVLLTYPSQSPPHATHHLQQGQASGSTTNVGRTKAPSPRLGATPSASTDSLHSHFTMGNGSRGNSVVGKNETDFALATYHVGILSKRRRKRGQGYARRFFSLDFASCTLSYYYSRNSSALRGAIPLSLAAISADERRREISIDSGAEVWHLKAGNAKDFDDWTRALEKASNTARGVEPRELRPLAVTRLRTTNMENTTSNNKEEDQEWQRVEALVSRIVGTRDAVRRLSKDNSPAANGAKKGYGGPNSGSPNHEEGGDYFTAPVEKRPFWKRKVSAPTTPQMMGRAIASQLAVPSPSSMPPPGANGSSGSQAKRPRHEREVSIQDHHSSLLRDLDSVINDFTVLLANSKRRRAPGTISAGRNSIDSTASVDEFYDAETGQQDRSQVVMIGRQSEEGTQPSEADDEMITDASSISSEDEDSAPHVRGAAALFPVIPKALDPLPIPEAPKRRKGVPPATMLPPSLIGFLRKNVGKDLSTVSMPVSSNEPISLLQRVAEQLEYATLLNTAASTKDQSRRILYVAAFAVSQFSTNRGRERAIRKPFNPMLGETYELVRTDKETPGGFRLIVEKVTHRPVVRMACQADSANWSLSQSPAPTQKFWGKSAELTTDGRVRMTLRLPDGSDELYSWNVATAFLRNVVMGEKYVEPVGTMTINNETAGLKATAEFKQKGMFGGRSEDVQVDTFNAEGKPTPLGLVGTWTMGLKITESGKAGAEIWRVGDLVDQAPRCYGLTTFAASLNEITELEKSKLPPTDTRLRPDQRAAEEGLLDEAEILKAKLEDGQRARRKIQESSGEPHKPKWFTRIDGGGEEEEVWKLKVGKEGYWDVRGRGEWKEAGVEDVLTVE